VGGNLRRVSRMASARRKRATRGLALTALAAALTAAAGASARGAAPPARPPLAADAAVVQGELAGIPQQGLMLGSSTAPVTVVEYTDLVCLPCASAATSILAPLIGDYVRQGTVRLVLAPITQSQRSSLYAYGTYAAGLQGQAWDFALLAYARSTARGDGPTDQPAALARALALNVRRWRASLFRPRWAKSVSATAAVIAVGDFTSFPVFTVRGLPDAKGHVAVKIIRPPVTLPALTAAIAGAQASPGH
jgi:hypothetical protein